MLRHNGKKRTFSHNLRLASLLSAVAGMVNITGVLALRTLTTNVTGHFAYFSEELFLGSYGQATVFLCFILAFLSGAFVSSLLLEWMTRLYGYRKAYVFPLSLELLLLCFVAGCGMLYPGTAVLFKVALSALLLFAMGLQNALVTRVSQSVVRTTHLTGVFTDLGIELSRLVFRKTPAERSGLQRKIVLKLSVVAGFFLGVVAGGFAYIYLHWATLLIPAGLLAFILWYDQLLFRFYHIRRRFRAPFA